VFPPETLHTERLLLRLPELGDAEHILSTWSQDPEVMRYLAWRPSADAAEVRAFLEARMQGWKQKQGALSWMIAPRDGGDAMGYLAFTLRDFALEIGYALAREHWGRGYMTEAVRAVVDAAFADPQIFRVYAVCDVEHKASARVLQKAGMSLEGVARRSILEPNLSPEPRDAEVYAIVR